MRDDIIAAISAYRASSWEEAERTLDSYDRQSCARLREALTPSADTKAAYAGEFHMGVTLSARGQEDYRRIQVPWTTIKEIMAAIRARAALAAGECK